MEDQSSSQAWRLFQRLTQPFVPRRVAPDDDPLDELNRRLLAMALGVILAGTMGFMIKNALIGRFMLMPLHGSFVIIYSGLLILLWRGMDFRIGARVVILAFLVFNVLVVATAGNLIIALPWWGVVPILVAIFIDQPREFLLWLAAAVLTAVFNVHQVGGLSAGLPNPYEHAVLVSLLFSLQGGAWAAAKRKLVGDLKTALAEVKTLRGTVPICCECKSIRNPDETWQTLEEYVGSHSYAEFSHGLCPHCFEVRSGEI